MKNYKKNYFILVIILIFTVFITLLLSKVYINRNKTYSVMYEYSNKITSKEFNHFVIENTDFILYLSDKNNISNNDFEEKFKNKITELGLKEKLIFIDKEELNSNFIKNINKLFNIDINLKKLPIVVLIVDRKVVNVSNVDNKTDIDIFDFVSLK